MHSEKKPTMEDTWKTGDLEKHLKRGVYDEDNMRRKDRRRRDEEGKKGRSGDSERRHRDHEREATRERDRHRERDATGERTKPRDPDKDKDQDRRREGTRDRTAGRDERERERRQERAEQRERVGDNSRARDRGHESRERRHERAEKDSRDGERERRRVERDRERGTERERKREEGRDGDRERDRERTREKERDRDREKDRDREHNYERRKEKDRHRDREKDRDREHNYERRKEKDRHRDRERGHNSKHVKEMNDYMEELQEKHYESKRENERGERHGEREHSRQKEDKEYQEQRRKEKEERERRHREREEHPRERRRREDGPKEEERERRRPERQEETRHHLSSDRRSHDQHGKRRPAEEGDGENGLVQVAPEARLHSGRNRERQEPKETKVEKEEVEIEKVSAEGQGDEDEAEYYEEDFEDYEDDFEEIDESDREEGDDGAMSEEAHKEEEEELSPQKRREIEEIRRAMNAENERVGSSQQQHAVEESEIAKRNSNVPQRKNTQHGKFIDFVAAKHREVGKKIASKQKKRSAELLRLIDLDFSVTFSLLDLPPVNEYDMYIKSFGTTNTKQAYVQCNEDNTDRDVQTEEIEADDKWTQHPGDSRTVCGGPKLISEASDESMAKMNIDSKRLAEFLLSASQVVAILLEEDRAEMHSWRKQKSQARTLSCSDGCLQLNTKLPFLHGREVSLISFSQVQRQTLLSVHGPATKPSAVRLDSKTILCIWNIWQPSCPQKVLVYESEVLCCCFSPGKATLVFAGTAVGSVVVWDLREHSTLHQTLRIGDNDWTLRYPTFSTDSVLSPVGHFSSVRSVEPVPVAVAEGVRPELSLLPSHQESSGLSFQLASLDESGVMNLWVVVELPKADQAGSQTDLGLKPGGKVKLLHSSTLFTNERSPQRDAVKTEPLRTLLLKFFPSDSSHFLIGTDMGLVTHGTRHGLKILPKLYRPQEDGLRPVHITAVDVSPFGEPLFLVGCADGSVRMHSVSSEQPVVEWSSSTAGQPVLSVQWALTRPGVFCVLDAASNLHVWDLLEKDCEPVATEELHSDRVTAMAVFGDPAKPNTLSGVSLAKQSGEIEIQYFSKRWAVPAPAEIDTLHNILNKSF